MKSIKEVINMQDKLCFVSSSGGHLEQLLMFEPLMKKYPSIIVTEDTYYDIKMHCKKYKLYQVNRKELLSIFRMIFNINASIKILLKEKPTIIISTGVLATIPICIVGKILRKKIVYVESFAKTKSLTKTGKLMYQIADQFYVQWQELAFLYPKSIYRGSLY